MTTADRQAQEMVDEAAAHVREQVAENAAVVCCDFCAHHVPEGERTTWVAESGFTFTMEALTHELGVGRMEVYYDPRWLACHGCDPVVAERDARKLAEHAIANRDEERVGVPVYNGFDDDLTGLYERFFAANPVRL